MVHHPLVAPLVDTIKAAIAKSPQPVSYITIEPHYDRCVLVCVKHHCTLEIQQHCAGHDVTDAGLNEARLVIFNALADGGSDRIIRNNTRVDFGQFRNASVVLARLATLEEQSGETPAKRRKLFATPDGEKTARDVLTTAFNDIVTGMQGGDAKQANEPAIGTTRDALEEILRERNKVAASRQAASPSLELRMLAAIEKCAAKNSVCIMNIIDIDYHASEPLEVQITTQTRDGSTPGTEVVVVADGENVPEARTRVFGALSTSTSRVTWDGSRLETRESMEDMRALIVRARETLSGATTALADAARVYTTLATMLTALDKTLPNGAVSPENVQSLDAIVAATARIADAATSRT